MAPSEAVVALVVLTFVLPVGRADDGAGADAFGERALSEFNDGVEE